MGSLSHRWLPLVSVLVGLFAWPTQAIAQDQPLPPETGLWLVPVDGAPRAGDIVTLELGAATAGAPAETRELPLIQLKVGESAGPVTATAPGRWRTAWQLPRMLSSNTPLSVQVTLGDVDAELPLPVSTDQRSNLVLPDRIDATAGKSTAQVITVMGAELPPPESAPGRQQRRPAR